MSLAKPSQATSKLSSIFPFFHLVNRQKIQIRMIKVFKTYLG